MTRVRKGGWRELVVLLAALACAASWAAGHVRSVRDRSEVAKMTENLKTVCVGRYLVDVPVQAEVSLSGGMLGGFEISTREESEVEFQARIAARETELKTGGMNAASTATGGLVESRELRIPNMIARMFVYGKTRSHGFEGERRVASEYASIETHAHMSGLSFLLSMQYGDDADIKLSEALLAQVQIRGKNEIPTVQGFCVSRAVFAEPLPTHNNEHLVMHLGLPGHPDLALALFSIAGAKSGAGILSRTAEVDAAAGAEELLRVTKIRAGKRNINGMEGEEMLERVREYNFATTYGFNWETRGLGEDPLQPYLSLELQTGIGERPGAKPVDTSLHEDALLSLWDSIASSIRLRKDGPPPPPAAPPEPSGPKLGVVASAGDICPQSGWWRCKAGAEDMSVHGGAVQYVRQGERMPQALLLPRQTVWQKLKRIQPSIESPHPTAWTLVDKRLRPRTAITVALAPAVIPADGSAPPAMDGRRAPVGSYVRTGDVCPTSGWWRCEEAHALDGTRWFGQGSLMPVATFQVPLGVFAKSAGPDIIQRRSMWQLVRHAEASMAARAVAPANDGLPINEPPSLA